MSDKDKKPEKALEDPKVSVEVTPKDDTKPEHRKEAQRVGRNLKENAEKAVKENERGGLEKQFKAADDETKRAGQSADPTKIEEIKVGVTGKDPDGHKVNRELTVTPGEGKPKP